ncbi:MAG: hypothetical protein JWM34_4891 [Ilumatobacteraceae bacterium]|nr:hypothetical protein [Ilumatobacteraceae bacterium]
MSAVFYPNSASDIVVRFGPGIRPEHAVYVRRRLVVALVFVGLCALLGAGVHHVLADRGGVPASTPAIRPATAPPAVAEPAVDAASTPPSAAVGAGAIAGSGAGHRYIVQPGDTIWSLAELFHGGRSVGGYVDALVQRNGGAGLQAGQLLTLP